MTEDPAVCILKYKATVSAVTAKEREKLKAIADTVGGTSLMKNTILTASSDSVYMNYHT